MQNRNDLVCSTKRKYTAKTNKTKMQNISLGTCWTVTKDITFMPLGGGSQKQRIKTVILKKYLKKQ